MSEVFWVFVAATVTALATGLGALPFVVVPKPGRSWIGVADALAAGCMVGASAGLLWEGLRHGAGRAVVGVVLGFVVIALTRSLLGHRKELHLGAFSRADSTRMLLIVGLMTVHSFTEGIGLGVSFGSDETLGVVIAIAIAIHNIPEGLAISLVLVPRGVSVRRAGAWSIFSSLPQPLMAVPAFLFVEAFAVFLPVGLGFAAGAMLWMVVAELLPEAFEAAPARSVLLVGSSAAAVMIALQMALL